MKLFQIRPTLLIITAVVILGCNGDNDTTSPSPTEGSNSTSSSSTSSSSTSSSSTSSSSTSTSSTSSSSTSSSSSGSGSDPSNQEFEAVINDFNDYENWSVVDYSTGRSNPDGLGEAHLAGDDTYTRKTLMNSTAAQSSAGEYEPGSILVKETFTFAPSDDGFTKTFAPTNGLLAMVKRGGDFNPDHNGWEWFILEPDLSAVIAQGEEPNGRAGCNNCHSQASEQVGGLDYIFPKPTEYVVEPALFADYASWDMTEHDTEPANLDGGAHIDGASLRRVFQKNIFANNTEAGDWGYPIGTVVVKDIWVDDAIQQIVAMVKRGGSFDPDNGNWEYFMLDPTDPTQVVEMDGNAMRGALGGCIDCHSEVADEDYIFPHQHAPFNPENVGQFVATLGNFANYTAWDVTDYTLGASNPFLAAAHKAEDETYSRQVFENATSLAQSGDQPYAPGSVIVKEVFTTNDNGEKAFEGLFAMAKRGGEFATNSGQWEWFVMDGEGRIQRRGADIGGCEECHSQGAGDNGVDYTFVKPSEVAFGDNAESLALLQGYTDWVLVDTNDTPGGAHAGTRLTYKKQAAANPYVEAGEYPVGTLLIKESVVDGSIATIYGMIKRGGDYNPDGGGWQWFTVNEALDSINDNGASPDCGGCHGRASLDDEENLGIDYVFYKEDDPVQIPTE